MALALLPPVQMLIQIAGTHRLAGLLHLRFGLESRRCGKS
jgi:hypothetical protein